ncbi:MAG TPA: hypothetical protein VGS21_08720, partial [Acidimicrobiales bacterium]|nr:hypothetical protein [Acidimicrobiales bacterium]
TIPSRRIRLGAGAVLVLLGFGASIPNAFLSRTQAGEAAAVVNARARSGDVVAYCPDQLGPSASRLIDPGLTQVTFPRRTDPTFVDWIDYAKVNGAGHASAFARYVSELAGPSHAIWYVWAPGYKTFGTACETIAADLAVMHGPRRTAVVQSAPDTAFEIFEGESLYEFGQP